MKVLDLVTEFADNDAYRLHFDRYQQLYPDLFEHYCAYWSAPGLTQPVTDSDCLVRQRDLILGELPSIAASFDSAGLNTSNLDVVLFVGVGTSNGHAMKAGDRFVVWLPVETYTSSLLVRVFVTHELAHACHYVTSPQYYFHNSDELQQLGRLLVTEGIATFATSEVLKCTPLTSLWGDYLLPEDGAAWLRTCQVLEADLAAYSLSNFYSTTCRRFFQIADPTDVYQNRAGYYIGLQAIKRLTTEQEMTVRELLSVERDRLDEWMLHTLTKLAHKN